jgi:hydrogenase expression/formation protein HypD
MSLKYLQEFRDPKIAHALLDQIRDVVTRPWSVMEVCGGQTHAIMQYGIQELLPDKVTLMHGPGCPVCVTPLEQIDKALAIAARHDVIFTSFGDMLRVPGSNQDLMMLKAQGSDVRVVYSPLDTVKIAQENPSREVVFFAVGFETTAPANAMAVRQASMLGLTNYSQVVSQVLVPPALKAILTSPTNEVQGFLAAGHVCTVMGFEEYVPIAKQYKVPIVVTGFEPLDLLEGILGLVQQLEEGRSVVDNQYKRSVLREGNQPAQDMITEVYQVVERKWRGIGEIPKSGLGLSPAYAGFDAELKFDVANIQTNEPEICIAGEVLQGWKRPFDCPAYGNECTPDSPLGATMVSNEGTCAAYYRYHGRAG